ncbi:transposase [Candidatus Leptofilum sp.]|uniref:transposase n=1 Tax=Candidatus Leptofilum sp. TaxID=3241576 RepID=UPI003B5AF07F
MKSNYKTKSRKLSNEIAQKLSLFLAPLKKQLDKTVDKRLVRTLEQLVQTIIIFRHQSYGLLLSELGGYLLSPEQAPAGTKRISNLLRSKRWGYEAIENYLWNRGEEAVDTIEEAGKTPLCLWDESVIEKGESLALEGLCAVKSSKAARLKRIKPGFFNPPGRPIFVPGMNWLMLMIVGGESVPTLAAMKWWTTRGLLQTSKRTLEKALLSQCAHHWGRRVVHVWDRGFAGSPWLEAATAHSLRFVLRWQKKYSLIDAQGEKRLAWKICRGKRSFAKRLIWDARRKCWRKTGIYYVQVCHEAANSPLFLVVSRPGNSRSPWYLLTSEKIESVEDAWAIVFFYARRWRIEMGFRFAKSDLAFESPRLWSWQNRLKLLLMASLAFAFLFSLLSDLSPDSLHTLLRTWCHRTGKRHRVASLPLYRLRSALSRLWLFYPPPNSALALNSG